MRRPTRSVIAALVAIAISFATSSPATANTSGNQIFRGVIVKSGASGTEKTVASLVIAKGVFHGIGHNVETDNLPSDPNNVTRDDLVFAAGSIHIRNVNVDFSMPLDPKSCNYTAHVKQTGTFVGGTRLFAAATGNYTSTVNAFGRTRRDLAGNCTLEQDPLYEVDMFAISGSLSF
jgi:hypothetical protein